MTITAESLTQQFVEGFAQLIGLADIGFTWRPDAAYEPTEIGLFIDEAPPTPNILAALTPYPLSQNPTLTDAVWGLQIRYRAGTRVTEVWAMRDAVRSYLHGRFPITLPTGVWVSSLEWTSGTKLPRDNDRRTNWSDNYQARISTHVA
jgi:hypothetical protein